MDSSEVQQMSMSLYALLVANSILMYDHVATLTEEITFIWCRPKALFAILFLVNRYLALLSNLYVLSVNFLPASEVLQLRYACIQLAGSRLIFTEVQLQSFFDLLFCSANFSCPKYFLSRELLIFIQQSIVCFILTLRTYALYGRSKRLLTWMALIFFVLAGLALAGTSGRSLSTVVVVPGFGCYESDAAARAVGPGLAWVILFAYELLIFVLTVFKIWNTRGLSLVIPRRNILGVVFQDGLMYFAAMTVFNIPNILMFYCGSGTARGNLATFTSCMSVTLVSRLVLNLHKSVDTGTFSTHIPDDDYGSAVLTSRVNVQSAISSP